MSPQEKLQYIKSKVVEACPEVMELSFGCGLDEKGEKSIFIGKDIIKFGSSVWPYTTLRGQVVIGQNYIPEIIGHPITLN